MYVYNILSVNLALSFSLTLMELHDPFGGGVKSNEGFRAEIVRRNTETKNYEIDQGIALFLKSNKKLFSNINITKISHRFFFQC